MNILKLTDKVNKKPVYVALDDISFFKADGYGSQIYMRSSSYCVEVSESVYEIAETLFKAGYHPITKDD